VQEGAGNLDPAPMTTIELPYFFVRPFKHALAFQLRVYPKIALASAEAMQRGVIAKVLQDGEIKIKRRLLEYHAE
jgi:hypothetical protein